MYGIIGYPLLTTFSPGYFQEKFRQLDIDETYHKFPLKKIDDLKELLKLHPSLKGLNVTIPYKQTVIPFLNALDNTAKQIGAVNTIQFKEGKLIGHNTDTIGFYNSLKPLLDKHHDKALILGTGGASKAVAYALQKLEIQFQFVSREKKEGQLIYADLDNDVIKSHRLIINTTPLGMKPFEGMSPEMPYAAIDSEHLLYDLIYSPAETPFLQQGKIRGATIKNGYEMLIAQAEAAWKIWNSI
ncbi:shikimate dehydrogenase [Taibaiella lutea]|uniref:Shikimate dehydrogenase n=1 Tax=Taibaiella lutea TaxID=2608001 RepID=A0A5M6CQQ7_9BACT|nr:shikimate dehydrogenase [Taibaiella lutea]KAA5537296.1 shikimate dehydrogenase [Taibaiella lutea]